MEHENTSNTKLIIVEGNIGTGKSTLLALLQKHLAINIIIEPTSKWQNIGSESLNLLDLFYKDTPRWAYTFQSYAFLTRIRAIIEHLSQPKTSPINILERSVYCDRFCFAKNCYESGKMSDLEWHIYKEWFLWLATNFTPQPSGFIYLRTTPEISYNRILKRSRSEEAEIPLAYIKALHNKHEDWLIHKKQILPSLLNIPVLVLNCDNDFENSVEESEIILEKVSNFIQQLSTNTTPKPLQKNQSFIA